LPEAKAVFEGALSLEDALTGASFPPAGPGAGPAPSPNTAAPKALRRRYLRLLTEIAQNLGRKPAGNGKRLRTRCVQAAELFAELREVIAQINGRKAAS
jgi:hypothetical protein